jgi:uncharacterized membrane protein YdbT with pleckstrin-like domain
MEHTQQAQILLNKSNRIIHWGIFILPAVILFAGIISFSLGEIWAKLYSSLLIIAGFFTGIKCLIRFVTTSIRLERDKYYIVSGLLTRVKVELPVRTKESIVTIQNLPGQMLGYCTMKLTGTGGSDFVINYVQSKELEKILLER